VGADFVLPQSTGFTLCILAFGAERVQIVVAIIRCNIPNACDASFIGSSYNRM
jgi:hypothetical protein